MKTKSVALGCLMFMSGAMVASLASAYPPQAVEHAPTAEQCRADRAYWMSKMEQPDGKGTNDVVFNTLGGWQREMSKCQVVDPENYSQYRNAGSEAMAESASRTLAFIMRHNLVNQFLDEDAAGKR
jgi:hypothetical protein